VVILRGALDGMAAVVPYGDPGLATLRAELVPPGPGQANGLLDLGGFYGLHPSLANLHTMFTAGELVPVHAVVGPTRVRSHFEAQDCLESGADHRMTSGWLNRAVAALPKAAHGRPEGDALAIGVSVPLLLRGPVTVGSWAPHGVMAPPADLYAQIAALHRADRITGPAIAEGLQERGFTAAVMASDDPAEPVKDRYAFPALARAAGEMLHAPDGPRVAALEIGGWDTHQAQMSRLAGALCTFSFDSHPSALPVYDHARLAECFEALDRHIRAHLELIVPSNCVQISLAAAARYFYEGRIVDERTLNRSRWIFGIRCGIGEADLIERTPRLVKICSREFVPKLVERALYGLKLSHIPVPPPSLSPKIEFQYFAIDKSGPCWEHMVKTREIGLYVPGELPDPEIELSVILES